MELEYKKIKKTVQVSEKPVYCVYDDLRSEPFNLRLANGAPAARAFKNGLHSTTAKAVLSAPSYRSDNGSHGTLVIISGLSFRVFLVGNFRD